jgi:CheY-like chemotaxis protein
MNHRPDWNDALRNCDFEMTAREIRDMLKMWKEEAGTRGEEPYYNPEFLAVLYPFLKTPSLDTAVPLLEVAPATYSVFEKCSPGGEFYEMNLSLNRGTGLKPDSKQGWGSECVPGSKQAPVRILVVDDDEAVRETICAMLEPQGYECTAVAGGGEALGLLESGESFDLLLTDLVNSPMDGMTLLERIKQNFPDIPVVIATALNNVSVAVTCARMGADEYMTHPVTRERLLASVGRALQRKEAHTGMEFKREPTYEELSARLRELEQGDASVQGEFTSETGRPSSTASELKAAFLDSARPDSPAPPGWWVLPGLGIVMSVFLLRFNTALGTICLVLTSSFFGVSWMRAKRNRPPRTPRTSASNTP